MLRSHYEQNDPLVSTSFVHFISCRADRPNKRNEDRVCFPISESRKATDNFPRRVLLHREILGKSPTTRKKAKYKQELVPENEAGLSQKKSRKLKEKKTGAICRNDFLIGRALKILPTFPLERKVSLIWQIDRHISNLKRRSIFRRLCFLLLRRPLPGFS